MLQRIFVCLLAYLMAFYPLLGTLANASSQEPAPAGFKQGSEIMSQESGAEKQKAIDESTKVKLQETYGKLPLSFIQNNGQLDEKVKYYEKGSGHATYFTNEGVYLSLVRSQESEVTKETAVGVHSVVASEAKQSQDKITSPKPAMGDKTRFFANAQHDRSEGVRNDNNVQSEIVKLKPIGANKTPEIIAEGLQEGKVNYFIGNDSKNWKTNIPTYQAVVYKDVYKDIDMRFYGNNSQMEYDIIVKPGADPAKAELSYEGIEGLKVTKEGDLEIALKQGKLIQKKPYIYQEIDGKRVEVDGRVKVSHSPLSTDHLSLYSYGFQVASYNKNHPLIIDPVLVYSTYLGGSGNDTGYGIAVDTSGNAYIAGNTGSTNFPLASPIQGANAGSIDAFITKINASGSSLVYSTYLGGSGGDIGYRIAVDISGNAYVTGYTNSTDFPTVSPIQATNAGGADTFIAKINVSGSSLVYSTYLGGSSGDVGYGIAVDTSGNAYIAGNTGSTNFPTSSPIQGVNGGNGDAFITKINASGSSLVYSTYLGGSDGDSGNGIAVDSSGNAYITGGTYSTNFPVASPIQATNAGGWGEDVFVTKINATGNALIYSTYLGGSGYDEGHGITVDTAGNAYITGGATSCDFPIASPIYYCAYSIYDWDAFITKISVSGTSLVYSTYLGGWLDDKGNDIAVDTSGNAYITGITGSTNLPTVSPIQGANAGGADTFIAKINVSGSSLVYSTYLGGSSGDVGYGIAVDPAGNAYITGNTGSTNFPLASPIQGTNAGSIDAFVAKVGPGADLSVNKSDSPDPVRVKKTLTYTVTVTNNGPDTATGVTLTDTLPSGVKYVSATPTQGSCSGTTTITCNLGTLINGGSATVRIVVTPLVKGTIVNTARVTGNETDLNAANNTATATTTVK